jgi:hypothetical protein
MGAPCAPGLIDWLLVLETTLARPGRRWQAWLATILFALAAGCSSAPLAGKPCPCATGYKCCTASNMCVADDQQCPRCTPIKLMSMSITHDGGPHPQPDGGPDAVQFGTPPEQWVSYTFQGSSDDQATLTMTPDGIGFHVTATAVTAYAGVGLSFLGDDCIDGTDLTGVQFEFDGDLGGRRLKVSVVADDDVSTLFDMRGICTGGSTMCFGPTSLVDPTSGPHMVPFQGLAMGMPVDTLSRQHIIKVQWQLDPAVIPTVDFTISNVQFYR